MTLELIINFFGFATGGAIVIYILSKVKRR